MQQSRIEEGSAQATFQTKVPRCDCILKEFTWLRCSSSVATSTRNITLYIFWRTGSLCTVYNCRHNEYQIAIVRHSLSLSYLRHNTSSRWHDVSLLTSRGSERATAHMLQQEKWASAAENTWCLIHLRFFIHSFYAPGKCDCVRSRSD